MKFQTALLVPLSILLFFSALRGNEPAEWITWQMDSLPALPVKHQLRGAFSGLHRNVLIVAGGAYSQKVENESERVFYLDSIFVCEKTVGNLQWKYAGKLPSPMANGIAVSTDRGLLCLGGENSQSKSNEVFLIKWDPASKNLEIDRSFPPIPEKCSHLGGASFGNSVFVAGGDGETVGNNFWFLDLSAPDLSWKTLPAWPGPPRSGARLIRQSNGEREVLYLMGGKNGDTYLQDAYRHDPNREKEKAWRRVSDLPHPVYAAPAMALGAFQIWLLGGMIDQGSLPFSEDILVYNTITDNWHSAGTFPAGIAHATALQWDELMVVPGGELQQDASVAWVFSGIRHPDESHQLQWMDYVALSLYLALFVWFGYFYAGKNKDTKDYFLGGQKIPFWAAGLSLMATQVSSIGFMAIPAKSFATDWAYFAGVFTWFIAVPVVVYAFVPFYRRLNVTSAYEYLEKRFNRFIRLFVASLYLLFQLLGRLGAIIFLPAIALSAVSGVSTVYCIMIIGMLATLYTVLGGMYAVIWTDVIQSIVMFGGIITCLVYIIFQVEGGLDTFMEIAWTDQKFSLGSFDMNLTMAVFWVIIIGNIFNRIGTLASDQSVVQRYLTTRDEKQTVRAIWLNVWVSIPWALLVFGLGTALYVFYKSQPDKLDPGLAVDSIVPFFIGQNLPAGISGLIIAGVFAAAMSSVDSAIHSSTTVLLRDFFGRALENSSESRKLQLARWMVFGLGILGTAIALVMTQMDITSVWDVILEIAGLFTGAMTGLFVLGIFTSRANGPGAAVGAVLSALLILYIQQFTPLHFFLYSGIGLLSSWLIGYVASLFFSSEQPAAGLTIYTIGDLRRNPVE